VWAAFDNACLQHTALAQPAFYCHLCVATTQQAAKTAAKAATCLGPVSWASQAYW